MSLIYKSNDIPGFIREIDIYVNNIHDITDVDRINDMLDEIIGKYVYTTLVVPYTYTHICEEIGQRIGKSGYSYTKSEYLIWLIHDYVETKEKRLFIYIILFIKLMSSRELNEYYYYYPNYYYPKKLNIAKYMLEKKTMRT